MFYEPKRDIERKVSLNEYKNVSAMLHFHKSIELIYVLEGTLTVTAGNNTTTINKHHIAFIPSYFSHSVKNLGETLSYTLIIPENYLQSALLTDLNYFFLDDKEFNKQLLNIFEKIQSEQNNDGLVLQGLIFELLGYIKNHYTQTSQDEKNNQITIQIIKYIQDNFTNEITLDSISKYFGYSKYYFSHKFNEIFGCNLKTYVNKIRFDNVMETDDCLSMTEKILSSGFNNISTFYKMKKNLNF